MVDMAADGESRGPASWRIDLGRPDGALVVSDGVVVTNSGGRSAERALALYWSPAAPDDVYMGIGVLGWTHPGFTFPRRHLVDGGHPNGPSVAVRVGEDVVEFVFPVVQYPMQVLGWSVALSRDFVAAFMAVTEAAGAPRVGPAGT